MAEVYANAVRICRDGCAALLQERSQTMAEKRAQGRDLLQGEAMATAAQPPDTENTTPSSVRSILKLAVPGAGAGGHGPQVCNSFPAQSPDEAGADITFIRQGWTRDCSFWTQNVDDEDSMLIDSGLV